VHVPITVHAGSVILQAVHQTAQMPD